MANAQLWSGVAQGLSQVSKDMAGADLRNARLAEAKSKQQLAQGQLEEFNENAPQRDRANELAMQELEAKTYSTNAQMLKGMTYDSFRRFESDKDTRHLNTWLGQAKNNPVGTKMYGDVTRVDPLTKTVENDAMLRKMGYADLDAVYADEDLSKDLVIFTGTDKRGIVNMNDMYAGTGFNNYMTNEELVIQERKARVNQMLRSGVSGTKVNLQERVVDDLIKSGKAKNVAEAYQMLRDIESKGKGTGVLSSTEERAVEQIQKDKNVEYLEALDMYYSARRQGSGMTNESRFAEQYMENNPDATMEEAVGEYKNLRKTSTQKEVTDVRELRKGLDEMNWLDSSVKDMSKIDRARVYRDYISPMEDLRNFKMSTEDKRTIRNLRDLTALGNVAGTELTPDETGLLDSTLKDFKKYMVNEVGGNKATASYETFRNVFRNAMYGASLTKSEITAFNKAAGRLGQKFQPVMAQLKVQMETIKTNLESIRDLNDPDIAHYYTGQSIEEIDDAIAAIEDRLTDPSLQLDKTTKSKGIKIRRLDKTTPKVDVNEPFNFDSAMKKAGL